MRARFPEFALGVLIGALAACALPVLPTMAVIVSLLAISIAIFFIRWRWASAAAGVLFGVGWLCLSAIWSLQARLPLSIEGSDVDATVVVVGLPEKGERDWRFQARVVASKTLKIGTNLRLSWYQPAPEVAPGMRIAATLRLRRPRGLINPGGFDFERYALTERIGAVGYVRRGDIGETLGRDGALDRLRARIATRIDAQVPDATIASLLRALAIGDVRGLKDADWDVLRATGTGHLIAISGLHVGLVAAVGACLFALLYRLMPRLGLHWPRPQAMAIGALMTASGYALLAGLGVPVLRTLLMIAVALSARLLRRHVRSVDALLLAAFVIVMIDPLSVLGAGFWLSFVGVAFLLFAMSGAETSWRGLWRAQVAMSIGLLPIGAWWFAQTSIIGFVANLFAVPWITFVIVPLLLVAMLFDAIVGSSAFYVLPASLLSPLWSALEYSAGTSHAQWHFAQFSGLAFALALIGAAWALLPGAVPLRWLGLLLFLPLIAPQRVELGENEFVVTTFDVGQGLSVLVRTREHALLFDSGARRSPEFNLGDAVVVPSLRALDVGQLDQLMTSHLDDDHDGGRASVLAAYPDAVESVGIDSDPAPRCIAGSHWTWDGVRFEVLHPPLHFPDIANDSSCVLRIASKHGSALIPGDIGALIEQRLAREQAAAIDVDLVIAAHHGSKNSSSPEFIAATSPAAVVFARGYRNPFGHPHPRVVADWQAAGVELRDTALDGAVSVRFDESGKTIRRARDESRVFWREQAGDRAR